MGVVAILAVVSSWKATEKKTFLREENAIYSEVIVKLHDLLSAKEDNKAT